MRCWMLEQGLFDFDQHGSAARALRTRRTGQGKYMKVSSI
jgi:hypothetical protein